MKMIPHAPGLDRNDLKEWYQHSHRESRVCMTSWEGNRQEGSPKDRKCNLEKIWEEHRTEIEIEIERGRDLKPPKSICLITERGGGINNSGTIHHVLEGAQKSLYKSLCWGRKKEDRRGSSTVMGLIEPLNPLAAVDMSDRSDQWSISHFRKHYFPLILTVQSYE